MGPPDPASTYPQWFQDRAGTTIAHCLNYPNDPTNPVLDPCTLTGTLPLGDNAPVVFPTNFPIEAFYARAVSVMNVGAALNSKATLVMALESSFTSTAQPVVNGTQIAFARFRLDVRGGLTPGATYTLTYPYGVKTFIADANGAIVRFTDDQGCLTPVCGFAALLTVNNIGPFLKGTNAPPGFIGDPNILDTITGSPFGTNFFRLSGPNAGGAGIDTVETNLFTVVGKLWTGTLAAVLTVDRTSYVRTGPTTAKISVFARSTGNAVLTAGGPGIPATTLTPDPVTGRFFAVIVPTTPASLPPFITITAIEPGSAPVVLDSPLIDEVTVSTADFDPSTGNLTISAASSDQSPKPALTAATSAPALPLGTLDAAGNLVVNTPVPPASVTVTSAAGGVGSLFVSLLSPAAATTTSLTASPNPILSTQAVTLTATVTSAAGTPGGVVAFLDGATTLGTGTLNASGVATLTVPANTLAAATHPLTAAYLGSAAFSASSSTVVNLVVNPVVRATTTTLVASKNPVPSNGNQANRTVVFSATVASLPAGSPTPNGTVSFRDGATQIGTGTLNASGVATFTTMGGPGGLARGTHSISAIYVGNAAFTTSTSNTIQLVVQ